jgi:transcriptional regulator with XRE-family HTH domain
VLQFLKLGVDKRSRLMYNKGRLRAKEMTMKLIGQRLTGLRKSINVSQMQLSKIFELSQSAINRYEHDESLVPDAILLKYADYFDVSLDYIFGRTDRPEGKLYEAKLPVASDKEEFRKFIEFCFEPDSPMNGKLKDILFQMMTGGGDEK